MNKFLAIIFDLDDSLYDERQFVESGFKAVAQFLSLKSPYPEEEIYVLLCNTLDAQGRGKVFDMVLEQIQLSRESLVEELVNIYRTHKPELKTYPETVNVLEALRREGYQLGLITDGHVGVQKSKVNALQLESYFDCMVFSDEYGVENQKPSEVPYLKVGEILGVDLRKTVYVGDNPRKDFITAKKLGIYTIRILRGQYKDMDFNEAYEAHIKSKDLMQVLEIIQNLQLENV